MKPSLLSLSALIFVSCKSDDSEAHDDQEPALEVEIVTYSGTVEHEEKAPKVTTTIERKPATPSDSLSKVLAASTEYPETIPMESIEKMPPVAKPVPDKPGFVFSPFTNKIVDVRGLPPGQLTRDPSDPNPDHKFRLPTP